MIKMSVSNAKRIGFSIKGYVFDKNSKIPVPVIEKAKKRVKRKRNTNKVELIKKGIIYKLNLKELKWL